MQAPATARRTARCHSTGKVQFGTRWAADRAVERAEADYNELWRAYLCAFCHCWHIGHATLLGSGPLRLVEHVLRQAARERAELLPERLRLATRARRARR